VGADAGAVGETFSGLISDPVRTGLWHTFFMAITIFVVALGVEQGLERAVRVLMPALIILLLILLGYGMLEGNFLEGLEFMFAPRFGDLTAQGVLGALGQAFFTLSVGMGAIMAYGAYLPNEESIVRTSIAVVLADTGIAILAGLVIFSISIPNGVEPAAGPGLVFESLPLAFGQMQGGVLVAVAFFVLLTFAAWTSAISLMEPAVTFFIERFKFSRAGAAALVGTIIWALGLLSVMSFGPWSGPEWSFRNLTIFENLDYLTNNIMLPLGGCAIVVFAGWFMAQNSSADELDPAAGWLFRCWRFSARYLAPVAIVLVMLHAMRLLPLSAE
jgi:NSS family neurotransmitter:Na+ symporter